MKDPFDSLRIRPGEPGDTARVSKDWKLSFCRSSFARFTTPRPDWGVRASQLYWDWQKQIIARLLEHADLWIATWAEAPSSIVGWCVMEREGQGVYAHGPVVHYVNVPPTYRLHGVAKKLLAPALEAPRVTYTHRTVACASLPIPPGWTYDPRPALEPRPQKESSR